MDALKETIKRIYQTNPHVHVTITISRPKRTIKKQEATITGIYDNIFLIESCGKRYTFQYADIVTNTIVIDELDYGNVGKTVKEGRCRI